MSFQQFFRSFIFHLYIYSMTAFLILIYVPALWMKPEVMRQGYRRWGNGTLWGMRVILNLKVIVQGQEFRPRGGGLVACKHQSMMETSVLFCLLEKPSMVLKKELTRFPFVGLIVKKAGLIVVDRKGGQRAVEDLVRQAKARIAEGYQVIIFPEGTRRSVGDSPHYKRGIVAMYEGIGQGCTPIALNSGVFWPRHRFIRRGGEVVFQFLPLIEDGLARDVFLRSLVDRIETASDHLAETAVVR